MWYVVDQMTKRKRPEDLLLVGCPLRFKTVQELQKCINDYFATQCVTVVIKDENNAVLVDKRGRPVVEVNPPTVSGLARHLGFKSRQSMYDYKSRPEFSYAINETVLRIEEFAEKQLFVGNPTGAIFWLKNKGWRDESQTDITTNGESINPDKKALIRGLLDKMK